MKISLFKNISETAIELIKYTEISTTQLVINFFISALLCTWAGVLITIVWEKRSKLHLITMFLSITILGLLLNSLLSNAIYYNELMKDFAKIAFAYKINYEYSRYIFKLALMIIIFKTIIKEVKFYENCECPEYDRFSVKNLLKLIRNYYVHIFKIYKGQTSTEEYCRKNSNTK